MKLTAKIVSSLVIAVLVLASPRAHAEQVFELHITDGEIVRNLYSCAESDIKDRVYKFVGKSPVVRVAGATIQLATSPGASFYDPVLVWSDGERRMAWFRSDQPATRVIVSIDPSKKVATARLAIVEHSVDRDCGETWLGTATAVRARPSAPRKTSP